MKGEKRERGEREKDRERVTQVRVITKSYEMHQETRPHSLAEAEQRKVEETMFCCLWKIPGVKLIYVICTEAENYWLLSFSNKVT